MHPHDRLAFTTRVAKRAQYDAFEFSVTEAGVRVWNCSHDEPADHEYVVSVADGLPTACDCPADDWIGGVCRRGAVDIRTPVLVTVRRSKTSCRGS